jgi:hypothetical protein
MNFVRGDSWPWHMDSFIYRFINRTSFFDELIAGGILYGMLKVLEKYFGKIVDIIADIVFFSIY